MKHKNTKSIVLGGLIAAIYAVLTWLTGAISYGPIQFRIAEGMALLPFLFPEAIPGLTLGCFLANLPSSAGLPDLIVGTVATLIGACGTFFSGKKKMLFPAILSPILSNGIFVGGVLAWYAGSVTVKTWLLCGAQVALSETLCVCAIGIPVLLFLRKIMDKNN